MYYQINFKALLKIITLFAQFDKWIFKEILYVFALKPGFCLEDKSH